MKHTIHLTLLLLTTLLPLSTLAQSQQEQKTHKRVRVEWGAIVGANVSNYATSDAVADIANKVGWQAGIVTALNFGSFAVEPQIIYMRQRFNINMERQANLKLRATSVDLPILASVRVVRPFRFYAGPVFTVMQNCKMKDSGNLVDFSRVRPFLSYTVGASVKIPGSVLIDLRYNGHFCGMRDVLLPDGVTTLDKIKSNSIALSVGYLF